MVSGNFLLDSESRMRMTDGQDAKAPADSPAAAKAQTDPVCGMDVEPAHAAGKSEYKGKTYYFCSAGCKEKFDGNPVAFLGQKND